jgi:hypothetical protein
VIPPAVRALFRLLSGPGKFGNASLPAVAAQPDQCLPEPRPEGADCRLLDHQQWRDLLAFADRTQLTLHLRCNPSLPLWMHDEIEARRVRNLARRQRLREALAEISQALPVDFVVLKGFTHERGFGIDPEARVQYDIDLLCAPRDIAEARRALRGLGYVPYGAKSLSDEHSRPLVRPFDWTWREDYFDPDMPIAIELHDSIWNPTHDRIPIDMATFWNRRTGQTLAEVDRAGFASLHVLRHVFRHDARLGHAFELSRLLETSDPSLWREWINSRDPSLRRLEVAGFRLASEWFGCRLAEAVEREWQMQSVQIKTWFRDFSWSPVENLLSGNKDAVWLHLALLHGWADRARVLVHRLTPFRLPQHSSFWARLRYHAGALTPALFNGVRWWWRRRTVSTTSQISDWNRGRV